MTSMDPDALYEAASAAKTIATQMSPPPACITPTTENVSPITRAAMHFVETVRTRLEQLDKATAEATQQQYTYLNDAYQQDVNQRKIANTNQETHSSR